MSGDRIAPAPTGDRGDLFIVSAPSGAGKSTLIAGLMRRLADQRPPQFSVSHTTRQPRPGERNGREYHFVARAEFEALIAADGFLEWAEVHGNLYGTSRAEVEPRLAAGDDVLLDIDVQGALQVLGRHPEAISVFVLPPSEEALRSRLAGRGTESADSLARRLGAATSELAQWVHYRFVIINDDSERASDALAAIVVACRLRSERMRLRAAQVLANFPLAPPAAAD
jgi:guanylate kinase